MSVVRVSETFGIADEGLKYPLKTVGTRSSTATIRPHYYGRGIIPCYISIQVPDCYTLAKTACRING